MSLGNYARESRESIILAEVLCPIHQSRYELVVNLRVDKYMVHTHADLAEVGEFRSNDDICCFSDDGRRLAAQLEGRWGDVFAAASAMMRLTRVLPV